MSPSGPLGTGVIQELPSLSLSGQGPHLGLSTFVAINPHLDLRHRVKSYHKFKGMGTEHLSSEQVTSFHLFLIY